MTALRRLLLMIIVSFALPNVSNAQNFDWRYEELDLPPAASDVRVLDGVYHAVANTRTSVLDTTENVWVRSVNDLGSLRLWNMQTSGICIVQGGDDIYRYNPQTGSVQKRDNVYYQFELSDSIICSFGTKYDPSTASFYALATWFSWPQIDTLQIDTLVVREGGGEVVACADSSALLFAQDRLLRYQFGKSPQVHELPDTVQTHRRSVYLDRTRTHIAMLGRRALLFSADHGYTWRSYLSAEYESIVSFCATNDPDVLLVALDRVLIRLHLSTGQRDTLHEYYEGASIIVDHGPKGAIVSVVDTVMLVSDVANTKSLIHSGLPQRSLVDLISVHDGIAGAGMSEIVHHRSNETWSTPSIDRKWLNLDPARSPIIFRGGRGLDDLWFTRGSWAMRLHPSDYFEAMENLLLPQASCWAHPAGSRFTVINDLDGYSGDRQVSWWSGSSPDRLLLAEDGLRFLVAFEDSVFVAFTDRSSVWRTADQTHERWNEISIPLINLGPQPKSQTKDRHGVVRGPRMKAWTHDAGATWQVDSLTHFEVVALAKNGVMYHVWEEEQQGSGHSLIIDRQDRAGRTVIAALPDSIFDRRQNDLVAAAFDDQEQRLYIATDHWVGSLGINTVSVAETTSFENSPSSLIPHGWYDLFGRYVGSDLSAVSAAGLYILVSERGVEKHVLSGQGLP